MKKEDLKALELSDEQISEIFKLNGQDINSLKSEKEELEKQLTNQKELVESANAQIEKFKDMNIDEIKKETQTYKEKFEAANTEFNLKLQQEKINHAVELKLLESKSRNPKAVKALLDMDKISTSENAGTEIENQLKNIVESDPYLFAQESQNSKKGFDFKVTGGTGSKGNSEITQEEFNKLNYMDRLNLKRESPELYEKLR